MKKFLVEAGAWPLPRHVILTEGKAHAEKVLTKKLVKEITAVTKFKGQKKAQARSTWEPYVFKLGSRWIVTCEHTRKLKGPGWRAKPAYEAAAKWCALLKAGELPFAPPNPCYSPGEW